MNQPQQPFDPATTDLEEGFDPALNHLQADEAASPEEEKALATGLTSMMEYLYSEAGLANVVQVLGEDKRELFEKIPDIAMPLLQKLKTEMPEVDPSVFFGDGGLIQQSVQLLWEIAEQEQIPGYQDEDQLSGAVINLYHKIGKYLEDSGDEQAKSEAADLGIQMALTDEEGTVQSPDSMMENNELTSAVKSALGTGAPA